MPTVYDVADQYRSELLVADREAALALTRAYARTWERVRADLDRLYAQIDAAKARGETVNPAWLFQRNRLATLQVQIEAELQAYGGVAGRVITGYEREAVDAAYEHAEALTNLAIGEGPAGVMVNWTALPREAVADLVGFLHDGSPLSDLLNELGPEASKAARDVLITGLALGEGPRQIGSRMRSAFAGSLYRAQTIARTEVLRAYREAALRNYRNNDDVVKGWVWHAALTARTCAACWAMHGTVHRLDERLDDHPDGRCSAVPLTRSWDELGYRGVPDTRSRIGLGADEFFDLARGQQLLIVGPSKLAALQDGRLEMADLVQRHRSERWGTWRGEASLAQAIENANRRRRAV